MGIGQRLKEARIANGLTQKELAQIIGVTTGAIGNYEIETSSPKEPILIKLMETLKIDANYLYQDYIFEEMSITEKERQLITLYRNANLRSKLLGRSIQP